MWADHTRVAPDELGHVSPAVVQDRQRLTADRQEHVHGRVGSRHPGQHQPAVPAQCEVASKQVHRHRQQVIHDREQKERHEHPQPRVGSRELDLTHDQESETDQRTPGEQPLMALDVDVLLSPVGRLRQKPRGPVLGSASRGCSAACDDHQPRFRPESSRGEGRGREVHVEEMGCVRVPLVQLSQRRTAPMDGDNAAGRLARDVHARGRLPLVRGSPYQSPHWTQSVHRGRRAGVTATVCRTQSVARSCDDRPSPSTSYTGTRTTACSCSQARARTNARDRDARLAGTTSTSARLTTDPVSATGEN